jgi:hypothetical protein
MGVASVKAQLLSLNQAVKAGGAYSGCKVGLVAGPLVPSKNTVLADIQEPTYPGYAQQAVTAWTPAYVGGTGIPQADGGDFLFQMTDASTPTTVYGFFLVQPAATGPPVVPAYLVETFMFTAPQPLATPDDGVSCDVTVLYGD